MRRKVTSIDQYLSSLEGDRRAALEKLRKTIRSIVPNAEECISYNIPAFRVEGKVIAGFLATSKGCSYYPFSGRTLPALARELTGYEQTRGSLHFDPRKGLPVGLIRTLIRSRIAELNE